MIERGFVSQKTKEYYIQKYIEARLDKSGVSSIKLKKIPLGEKIIINTSRPSLIVGSKGSNIKDLTKALKKEFQLENPQIEINEVKNPYIDAVIVASRISSYLERFGLARFKSIGHKMMENVMNSGALGVEILISGKIPSARAKRWRFYQGYLKKSGSVAMEGVNKATTTALLKTGVVGIMVSIMPPDVKLPDEMTVRDVIEEQAVEVKTENTEKKTKEGKKKETKPRKAPVKKKKEETAPENKEEAKETEITEVKDETKENESA